MIDFTGVKIALLHNARLLMIQRDDKPGINFPGLWDFPGGARDDEESPIECVTREVNEELAIKLHSDSIIYMQKHPAMHDPKLTALFMVAKISDKDVDGIKFGNEGQGWKFMGIDEFMKSNDVVEPLKGRLQEYLDSVR